MRNKRGYQQDVRGRKQELELKKNPAGFSIRLLLVFLCLFSGRATFAATTESLRGASLTTQTEAVSAPADDLLTQTLGKLLDLPMPANRPDVSFYEEIPPNLEPAVRWLAEENVTSAAALLERELAAASDARQKARILMWLGLTYGRQVMDYPVAGGLPGTSATTCLRSAMELDPLVYDAPEVAKMLAEMVGSGWTQDEPNIHLDRAEAHAEKTRRAVDFYYAAVLARRLSARSWKYMDTTAIDKRALGLLMKAVSRDPWRYETWTVYLPALMPLSLHDLMSTESEHMYRHFRKLRCPLIFDQGPAALYVHHKVGWNMFEEEAFLNKLVEERPDDPYAHYELASRAIMTTPALALKSFEKMLAGIEGGQIKLKPKEHGYKVSTMYKLAFMYQFEKGLPEALDMYRRIKAIVPTYTELNLNMAIVLVQLADKETTGPKKLALLEEAVARSREQETWNYQDRAASNAVQLRRHMQNTVRQVRKEMGLE